MTKQVSGDRQQGGRHPLSASALIHELQGHITSLSMFCSQINETPPDSAGSLVKKRIVQIRQTAKQMQRIVDAVKAIDCNEPPSRTRIDLSGLASKIVASQRELNPAYEGTFVQIEPSMEVLGDPAEVEMLIDNLVSNAFKFSGKTPCPRVYLSSSVDGAVRVFHITDNGVGIAPEDSSRVFELFARAHPEFAGSGIGLAVVQRIAERHGGWVSARGQRSGGATISFCIPDEPGRTTLVPP